MNETRDPIVQQPEWIRPSQIPIVFGISRSVGYELLSAKKIKSVVLRKPGNIRGCRLISVDSIRAYLSQLAAEQEK